MSYQIVRVWPVYHWSTDHLMGSKAEALPMSYKSEALAHKLAGKLSREAYEGCSDDSFYVIPYGGSPFLDRKWPAPSTADDMEIPF